MYKAINLKTIIVACCLFTVTCAAAQAPAKNAKNTKKKLQQFNQQMQDPAFRKMMEQYGKAPGKTTAAGDASENADDAMATGEPIITEKGRPVGMPSEVVLIGAAGGTVISPDGMLTVTVPEGALLSETGISIQPITNNAPLGAGSGYRLLPDGTQFAKPVQLRFTYNDSILEGTCKELLCIETQEEDGSWTASRAGVLDTIAQTLTLGTMHFSDWGTGAFAKLALDGFSEHISSVRIKQKIALWVLGLSDGNQPKPKPKKPGDYEDDLAPLTPVKKVGIKKLGKVTVPQDKDLLDAVDKTTQAYKVKKWTLNGVTAPTAGKNGTLTGHGWFAGFTAPDNLPARNPVAVSVELAAKPPVKGQFVLTSNILVEDFHLNLTIDGKLTKYTEVPVVSDHTVGEVLLYPAGLSIKAASASKDNPLSLLFAVKDFHRSPGFSKSLTFNGDDPDQFAYMSYDQKIVYGLAGKQRKKGENGSCEETDIGNSVISITETGYLGLLNPRSPQQPIINPKTWLIKGTIKGILYEDNPNLEKNCQSSIPHPYSASFYLQLLDYRDMKDYKKSL